MQETKLNYENISQAISNLNLELLAEELHGQMCGVLITSPMSEVENWLFELIGVRDENNIIAKSAVDKISGLLSTVITDLNDNEFKFKLLMPDDDASISIKLKAFANWCDSFLYGFGLAQTKIKDDSESMEFIKDLSQIVMVDTKTETDSQNDLALEELIEYVRMGVLLLQENHRQVNNANTQETLQ